MKFVIVGGGITGWLSALILSVRQPSHEYLIIESPDINTIGVGEGTTGFFMNVIDNIPNISIKEFIKETKATPKIGIEFTNWSNQNSNFFNPIDGTSTTRNIFDSLIYYTYIQNKSLDTSSLHGFMKRMKKTPFFLQSGELKNYITALHLDNKLTVKYLKKKALDSKNLNYVSDTVSKVERDENGNVIKLVCDNTFIEGDIFIDCTGFGRIFSKKSDWISFENNLPMNSVTTFTRKKEKEINCITKSNALSSGWSWQIPTQERIGCGYVNCDRFISQDEVIDEIKFNYPDAEIKNTFKFNSGKLKNSWNNNVISIGLAYHFLEPLQATNIHLTLIQLDVLCQKYISNTKENTLNKSIISSYNKFIDSLIENFKNFINIHYSGGRDDTKFWKSISSGEHITDFNKDIIGILKIRGLFATDLPYLFGGSGIGLWGHTLLGLNHISKEQCNSFLKDNGFYNQGRDAFLRLEANTEYMPYLTCEELVDNL